MDIFKMQDIPPAAQSVSVQHRCRRPDRAKFVTHTMQSLSDGLWEVVLPKGTVLWMCPLCKWACEMEWEA